MANFLTDARTALLAELKGDAQVAALVRTWFEFGPGLRRRFNLEPAACPLVALSPVDGEALRTANALTHVAQRLRVSVATAGQDAEPCEQIVALVLDRIAACDEDCLGLAADGLAGVDVEGIHWRCEPDEAGARTLWTADVDVALRWHRT